MANEASVVWGGRKALERLVFFLVPLLVLMLAEAVWAKRNPGLRRQDRWPGALGLVVLGTLLSRLVLPVGLAGIAIWSADVGFGLLNWIEWPAWAAFALAIILLDLSVWFQHVLMHRVDLLWRLHRVHHADPDIDVTTALRFHPGEFLISLAWKGAIIATLGAPPEAVLAFEILLNLGAMFNHANLALPKSVDTILRAVIVTPDMHRVHHSVRHEESTRNFGFCLSCWDRLFGLYISQPRDGHQAMAIGQSAWRNSADQSILSLLKQPIEPDTR